MPVTPKAVPVFTIRPPLTSGDKGKPSTSIRDDAHRVFAFVEDERHLTAHNLYLDVSQRLKEWEKISSEEESPKKKHSRFHVHMPGTRNQTRKENAASKEATDKAMKETKQFLESKQAAIEKLENKCRLFRRAQRNLNIDEDWTVASHHFGITTYYRREDDGSLSIKLEGEVKDVPLFEQVCVLKEVDLHYKWSPFCTSSMTIADLDKLDVVGWFMVGAPTLGLARDGCFRAISCDNITEDGSIILAGQGVKDRMPNDEHRVEDTYLTDDPIIDKLDIPSPPSKRGSGRMTIRKFEAVIHVTSATSAKTRIVANVDPNMQFLPQSLIEWVMKNLAGVLLAKLQHAAKKIPKHPVTNEHARKMREEYAFYKEWLMKKFEAICDEKDWEMPTVTAFELSDEQLRKETQLRERKAVRRLNTYSGADDDHEVVENLSMTAVSTPPGPEAYGDGSVSELTSRSGLSWMSNPLGSYLRDMEERTQQRKAAAIREARQRAAARLRPKDLSTESQERLNELKLAKARRTADGPIVTQELSTTNVSLSFSQKVTDQLYEHTRTTRFIVISALVIALFIILHPEPLLRFAPIKVDPYSSWLMIMLEDAGTVVYILFCSIVYFALCDVALVYAFDSVQLGSKTGQEAKRYYGDNVRAGVGLASAGIVGLSIIKAALKVWLRASLYYSTQVFNILHGHIWPRQWISSARTMAVELIPDSVLSALITTASAITSGGYNLLEWMIFANPVGRMGWGILKSVYSFVVTMTSDAEDVVTESIEGFDGKMSFVSWRTDAFDTARSFFSYTAIFLLSTLWLFSLSAKSNRPVSSAQSDQIDSSSPQSPKDLLSKVSSLSDNDGDFTTPNQVRGTPPKIPEDEEVFHDIVSNGSELAPIMSDSSQDGTPSNSRRRRMRLRFRREKMQSMATDMPTTMSEQRPALAKSETF